MTLALHGLSLALALTALLSGSCRAQAETDYQNLRDKVHYVDVGSLKSCTGTWPTLNPTMAHDRLLRDLLPLRNLEEIKIGGDAVSLPSEIVLQVLTNGRFTDGGQPAQRRAYNVHLRFKGGRCLEMKLFPSYKYQVYHQVLVGSAWCETKLMRRPGDHLSLLKDFKEGRTTRKELSKFFYADGGISVPFRCERFVGRDFQEKGRVLKMNVAFRPARGGRETSDSDVVTRVSPLYMDYPISD